MFSSKYHTGKDFLSIVLSVFCSRTSQVINFTSGVPQGNHLEPFRYILFVNDVHNVVSHATTLMSSSVFLFFSDHFLHKHLHFELDEVFLWCSINLLILNCSKCKVMTFNSSMLHVISYSLGKLSLMIWFDRSMNTVHAFEFMHLKSIESVH